MTEEEAKTKRCCGPNGCGTLINPVSGGNIPKEMLLELAKEVNSPRWCNASECAAWAWKMHPKDAAFLNKIGDNKQEPQGYCGLTRGE